MLTLDCESPESALSSISTIYKVPSDEIEAYLRELRIDEPDEHNLISLFENQFQKSPCLLHRVFWFHATRILPEERFADGILPAREALIWRTVYGAFAGRSDIQQNLEALRGRIFADSEVQGKLQIGGPFAVLVRDFHLKSDAITILTMPEILRIILNMYKTRYLTSISDDLSKKLRPHIVKFWTGPKLNSKEHHKYISKALLYLYMDISRLAFGSALICEFRGKNRKIPARQILGIEPIAEEQFRRPPHVSTPIEMVPGMVDADFDC